MIFDQCWLFLVFSPVGQVLWLERVPRYVPAVQCSRARLSPMEVAEEFWAAEELREAEEAAKLRLLQEQLASLPGAVSAASWTLEQLAELEALIRRQKGVCEDRDVGLLSEVKRWFKQAGMPRLDPRETVVKAVQARLWPN